MKCDICGKKTGSRLFVGYVKGIGIIGKGYCDKCIDKFYKRYKTVLKGLYDKTTR